MTRAGYVSVKVVDDTGKQLDSDVVLAHLYVTGSPLYNVVSSLIRAGHIGELFALFRREGFKVRYEGGVWKVEHYQYSEVKGVLHPQEDGGFVLEVVVPAMRAQGDAERALLAAWRALRALSEVNEVLSKLKERIGQLEDELRRQREELRGIREALSGFEERARTGSEGEEE
jgi:hypothetical protein